MIRRVLAIDPKPQTGRTDILVYQVPGGSREEQVLIEALNNMGIECEIIDSVMKPKPKKK